MLTCGVSCGIRARACGHMHVPVPLVPVLSLCDVSMSVHVVVACRACGMSVCMSVVCGRGAVVVCPSLCGLSVVCREPCRLSVLACGDVTWRHVSGLWIYVVRDTPMDASVSNGFTSRFA